MSSSIEIELPQNWGTAWIAPREEPLLSEQRSYDAEGRRLCWHHREASEANVACDFESSETDVAWLSQHYGCTPESFRLSWTLTEVLAKLQETPICHFLRSTGLFRVEPYDPNNCFEFRTYRFGEIELLGVYSKVHHSCMGFGRLRTTESPSAAGK